MSNNYLKVFDRYFHPHKIDENHATDETKNAVLPTTDLWLTKDGYQFMIDLPGVTKDNLSLKIENDHIQVAASANKPDEHLDAIYLEKNDGYKFFRLLKLPKDANTEKISASLEDGVLKLMLPLNEDSKPKKIVVN